MSGIKKVFEEMNSRKMKVFLLFLLCSFLAWSISKLSDVYESRTNFEIKYTNLPDSLLLREKDKNTVAAKIKASGFQFLRYSINPRTITLDLEDVLEEDGDYFLTGNTVKVQMENQLPNSISLIELEHPVYYTGLYLVDSKRIPVIPKIHVSLAQNHILQGKLKSEPDSITIKGPKNVLKNIKEVQTTSIELNNITDDFTRKLSLRPLDSLGNVVMDVDEVRLSGKVVRFSEKEFDVGIKAKNVPQGFQIRMFPDHVQLVCKAEINTLKDLETSDFEVIVDYKSVVDNKYLLLELSQKPENVFSVRLLENRIEFVLEKI